MKASSSSPFLSTPAFPTQACAGQRIQHAGQDNMDMLRGALEHLECSQPHYVHHPPAYDATPFPIADFRAIPGPLREKYTWAGSSGGACQG